MIRTNIEHHPRDAIPAEKNTEGIEGLVTANTTLTQEVKKATDLLEEIHRHVAAMNPGRHRFGPR